MPEGKQPESEEVAAEDWGLFARYQHRLLGSRPSLRQAFAARGRPGLEAYDRLVSAGLLSQCAWCGCVRLEQDWVQPEDLTRLVRPELISHGICPRCTSGLNAELTR